MGGADLTNSWHMMIIIRHDVVTTLNFGFTFITSGNGVKHATTMHFPIHHNSRSKYSNTQPYPQKETHQDFQERFSV